MNLRRLVLFLPLVVVGGAGRFFSISASMMTPDGRGTPRCCRAPPPHSRSAPSMTLQASLRCLAAQVPGQPRQRLGRESVPTCTTPRCRCWISPENRGVHMVGVDHKDTRAKGRQFLEEFGDPFSVAISSTRTAPWGLISASMEHPETFFQVDAEGVIRYHHTGYIRPPRMSVMSSCRHWSGYAKPATGAAGEEASS